MDDDCQCLAGDERADQEVEQVRADRRRCMPHRSASRPRTRASTTRSRSRWSCRPARAPCRFWYQPQCAITKTADQLKVRVSAATAQTLISACTSSTNWVKAAFDTSAYAGQDVMLWFSSIRRGARSRCTCWSTTSSLGQQLPGVANGGFETGDLTGWQRPAGEHAPSVVSSTPHTGTHSALPRRRGTTPPRRRRHQLGPQAIIVPGINPTLTVWYLPALPRRSTSTRSRSRSRARAGRCSRRC